MNEALRITLRRNKRRWPVDSFDARGLVLNKEKDALPRVVRLVLAPVGDSTRSRVDWMLRRRGKSAIELKVSPEDGDLLVRGADEAALPEGFYSFRVDIEDLKTATQRIEIEEGKTRAVWVDVSEDRRRVVLKEQIDPEISRILGLGESRLDDRELSDWLMFDGVRAKRKACLLNIITKLRCAPLVSAPLSKHLVRVFFCDVDRIYCEVDPAMLPRVQQLASDPKRPFYAEGPPAHPAHKRLLATILSSEGYLLDSYREEGGPSMQIVFAVPPDSDGPLFVECDIDLGNPLQDVAGLLVHIPEVVGSARSDHLSMWKKLQKGKTGAYLPYTVA